MLAEKLDEDLALQVAALKILQFADLIADREYKGTDWCNKHGIGARRYVLGPALPSNVTGLPPHRSRSALAGVQAQRLAQKWLAEECKRCGGCKLGRDGE